MGASKVDKGIDTAGRELNSPPMLPVVPTRRSSRVASSLQSFSSKHPFDPHVGTNKVIKHIKAAKLVKISNVRQATKLAKGITPAQSKKAAGDHSKKRKFENPVQEPVNPEKLAPKEHLIKKRKLQNTSSTGIDPEKPTHPEIIQDKKRKLDVYAEELSTVTKPISGEGRSVIKRQRLAAAAEEKSESSSQILSALKQAPLTKENLRIHRRALRAMARNESKSKSSRWLPAESKTTITKETTVTTSASCKSFPLKAANNGILSVYQSRAPSNLADLESRVNRERESPPPTEAFYKSYRDNVCVAPNEYGVVSQVTKLLKDYPQENVGYGRVFDQGFNDFPRNVGFNNGLSPTTPDLIEGLCTSEYAPFPVREQLGGAAVPTNDIQAVGLPHFAVEFKRRGGEMGTAMVQASYDGACMVYGRNHALSYLGKSDPPGHALILSADSDGDILRTYCHYTTKSATGKEEYHQVMTSGSYLLKDYESFKKGYRRLRNVQEDAKIEAEKLRDDLCQKWATDPQNSQYVPIVQANESGHERDRSCHDIDRRSYTRTLPEKDFAPESRVNTNQNTYENEFDAFEDRGKNDSNDGRGESNVIRPDIELSQDQEDDSQPCRPANRRSSRHGSSRPAVEQLPPVKESTHNKHKRLYRVSSPQGSEVSLHENKKTSLEKKESSRRRDPSPRRLVKKNDRKERPKNSKEVHTRSRKVDERKHISQLPNSAPGKDLKKTQTSAKIGAQKGEQPQKSIQSQKPSAPNTAQPRAKRPPLNLADQARPKYGIFSGRRRKP